MLVAVDWMFLPSSARRSRRLLAGVFFIAGLLALSPEPLFALTGWLGVGRPVDMVMYFSVAVLVRELFISRARVSVLERDLTRLVRVSAIRNATAVGPSASAVESGAGRPLGRHGPAGSVPSFPG